MSERKCIVKIPELWVNAIDKNSKPTKKVIREAAQYDAVFHAWTVENDVVGESYVVGGHPGGVVQHTYGIVEDAEGRIHLVSPECIKFVNEKRGKTE